MAARHQHKHDRDVPDGLLIQRAKQRCVGGHFKAERDRFANARVMSAIDVEDLTRDQDIARALQEAGFNVKRSISSKSLGGEATSRHEHKHKTHKHPEVDQAAELNLSSD